MKLRGIDDETVELMVGYHDLLAKTQAGDEFDDLKQDLDKLTIQALDDKNLVNRHPNRATHGHFNGATQSDYYLSLKGK